MAIDGTSFIHMELMELKPPIITIPARRAITMPSIWIMWCGRGITDVNAFLIELDWVVHPTPKDVRIVSVAKITARNLLFRPCSNTYIGPPRYVDEVDVVVLLTSCVSGKVHFEDVLEVVVDVGIRYRKLR